MRETSRTTRGTRGSPRRGTTVFVAAMLLVAGAAGPVGASAMEPPPPRLSVVSTRPDMIAGTTVLVAAPTTTRSTTFAIDGKRATAVKARPGQWLVTGLTPGRHRLTVTTPAGTTARRIRVFPITGPVFSGPHPPVLACSTQGLGLGPPTDADCSAPTKITYQYRNGTGKFLPLLDPTQPLPADVATTTVSGRTVPYVVRTEEGVINRSVYWISILDPTPGASTFDPAGWNGRLVYRYGGGCGQSFGQGSPLGVSTVADGLLGKGYAVTTATFNTFQVQCNDVLSAETTMMVEQHFAETYGPPKFTIGDGGSGGAIQQLLIAQDYPGLLDAIAPTIPFPDAISISPGVTDCGLLGHYFATPTGAALTADQRASISGYQTWKSCELWISSFLGGVRPADGCDPGVPKDRIYDPTTNPRGLRCDLADANADTLGVDPATGFANRPLDNLGVQYGLAALNAGKITPDQFLDLNETIGGYDRDGNATAARETASPATLRRAYAFGRVFEGDTRLRSTPIITTNYYTDPAGDIHTRFRVFSIRDRLRSSPATSSGPRGGGVVDPDQTSWTRPSTASAAATLTGAIGEPVALTTVLDDWLTSGRRPAAAEDNCTDTTGATLASGPDATAVEATCNRTYPVFGDPRTAAGAPVVNDILKCRRTSVRTAKYTVPFTAAQRARLARIFPRGVCDWSRPGVGQTPMRGTWFDYSLPSAPVARGAG